MANFDSGRNPVVEAALENMARGKQQMTLFAVIGDDRAACELLGKIARESGPAGDQLDAMTAAREAAEAARR